VTSSLKNLWALFLVFSSALAFSSSLILAISGCIIVNVGYALLFLFIKKTKTCKSSTQQFLKALVKNGTDEETAKLVPSGIGQGPSRFSLVFLP
jgi:hypothetical protein